jgi:hypothetical protein
MVRFIDESELELREDVYPLEEGDQADMASEIISNIRQNLGTLGSLITKLNSEVERLRNKESSSRIG